MWVNWYKNKSFWQRFTCTKNCCHRGGGCQKSGKIADVTYGWSLIISYCVNKNYLGWMQAEWLASNNSELSLLHGTSLQPTYIHLPYLGQINMYTGLQLPYIFFEIWNCNERQESLDSSVGRAGDCREKMQTSLGHWFESGSREFFKFLNTFWICTSTCTSISKDVKGVCYLQILRYIVFDGKHPIHTRLYLVPVSSKLSSFFLCSEKASFFSPYRT